MVTTASKGVAGVANVAISIFARIFHDVPGRRRLHQSMTVFFMIFISFIDLIHSIWIHFIWFISLILYSTHLIVIKLIDFI